MDDLWKPPKGDADSGDEPVRYSDSSHEDFSQFLNEQLGTKDSAEDRSKTFFPITNGLGLSSPERQSPLPPIRFRPPPKENEPLFHDPPEKKTIRSRSPSIIKKFSTFKNKKKKKKKNKEAPPLSRQARVITPPRLPSPVAHTQKMFLRTRTPPPLSTRPIKILPPPVPHPTLPQRIIAAVFDEVFVLSLWGTIMLITVRLVTGNYLSFLSEQSSLFNNSIFINFAIAEFIALWICYLSVGIGVLNMTFGMWVWGIRVGFVGYGKENESNRKFLRVLLSFLFYAPIAPLVFLLFRNRQKRNLLDTLSGTMLYRVIPQ